MAAICRRHFPVNFLAATKQFQENVCLSVRLSHLFYNVPVIVSIMKFSGVITIDESDVHAKGQGHRGQNKFWFKLNVSGLNLQFKSTDGYEMMHKAWSKIEEMPYNCFSRSSVKFQGHTGQKNHRF